MFVEGNVSGNGLARTQREIGIFVRTQHDGGGREEFRRRKKITLRKCSSDNFQCKVPVISVPMSFSYDVFGGRGGGFPRHDDDDDVVYVLIRTSAIKASIKCGRLQAAGLEAASASGSM